MPTMPSGPFTPGQSQPCFFAFYADDCLLHFQQEELTPKQQEDHEANIVLTAMLQVALTYVGRHKDHAALHDQFREGIWSEVLAFYNQLFQRLFSDVIPPEHYHYFPRDGFYEAIAENDLPGELLSLYMISGSNLCLHNSFEAWQLSQKVNSKMHFAETAPAAGIRVPETMVTTKGALASQARQNGGQNGGQNETRKAAQDAADFFARHPQGVMLKIQGLAGARNVTRVNDIQAANTYLAAYDANLQVLLQEALDLSEYTEMTVDLDVRNDGISITNVRKILFAEGLWVGNFISDSLRLLPSQEEACLQVGAYVRELGYTSALGYNCGIDFFVRGEEIVMIEINARWTGGLFPTQLIKRLQAESETSVAFIDTLGVDAIPAYLDYLERCCSAENQRSEGFRIVPMGFSPFPQTMDGIEKIYVWQVVLGDFEAFKAHKNSTKGLGVAELPVANLIVL